MRQRKVHFGLEVLTLGKLLVPDKISQFNSEDTWRVELCCYTRAWPPSSIFFKKCIILFSDKTGRLCLFLSLSESGRGTRKWSWLLLLPLTSWMAIGLIYVYL